jgi:hypothetical protein
MPTYKADVDKIIYKAVRVALGPSKRYIKSKHNINEVKNEKELIKKYQSLTITVKPKSLR